MNEDYSPAIAMSPDQVELKNNEAVRKRLALRGLCRQHRHPASPVRNAPRPARGRCARIRTVMTRWPSRTVTIEMAQSELTIY
jgi:hypothetical protein